MSRAALISLMALISIFCAVLFSGCSTLPPDVNNTVSNDTALAFGHVYLDNKTVAGASIEAVSLNGSLVVTTRTNARGAYTLNLLPGVSYNVTATSDGLNHTITPVYLPPGSKGQTGYDIIMSKTHRSAISGVAAADSMWKGKGVYIQAIPLTGSQDFVAVTGDDGSYTLDLVPDVDYYVMARTYQPDGQEQGAFVYYRNTTACARFRPAPDETILLDYKASLPSADSVPTILVPTPKPTVQPAAVSGPVTASGHVYLDGQPVYKARVEAVSIDGHDRLSVMTNATGAYALDIVSWVKYDITATYSGFKHTITPVYLHYPVGKYPDIADQYDINLSRKPSSTLKGLADPKDISGNGSGALVIAIGADGDWQAALIDNGRYSFDLKPGVSYTLAGNYMDVYGQNGYLSCVYRNGDSCNGFTAEPDTTILIDTRVTMVHPPKSLFWTIGNNTSEFPRYLPPTPVSISGHVYLDGKPVSHASVQAIIDENNVSAQAFTDDSGAYVMGLMSKTMYRLVVTYQGKHCIVKPVFLKDNTTDVYEINLTSLPRQGMMVVEDSGLSGVAMSGKVTLNAVPLYGGAALRKVFDPGEGFFLDLAPDVYYNVSGTFHDAAGQGRPVYFSTIIGSSFQRMLVRPNETVLVDYYIVPRPAEQIA
jgi:hypothetical protein